MSFSIGLLMEVMRTALVSHPPPRREDFRSLKQTYPLSLKTNSFDINCWVFLKNPGLPFLRAKNGVFNFNDQSSAGFGIIPYIE